MVWSKIKTFFPNSRLRPEELGSGLGTVPVSSVRFIVLQFLSLPMFQVFGSKLMMSLRHRSRTTVRVIQTVILAHPSIKPGLEVQYQTLECPAYP